MKKKVCNTGDLLARELITPLFAFIGAGVAHMPHIAGHFYTHKTEVLMDTQISCFTWQNSFCETQIAHVLTVILPEIVLLPFL